MIMSLRERAASWCFDTLVLLPITEAHKIVGDRVWNPLDHVAGFLARGAGRMIRPFLSSTGPHRLSQAMEFIDKVEALVGVRGSWKVIDDATVLRSVPYCPFAGRLARSSSFCTLLGVTMGQQALARAFPEQKIDFEILETISNGNPCCTYRLTLK